MSQLMAWSKRSYSAATANSSSTNRTTPTSSWVLIMTAPLPQHILMNIQISRRLNDGNAAEWQLEGIASAKARGVYKGGRPSIDPAEVKKMKADGMGLVHLSIECSGIDAT